MRMLRSFLQTSFLQRFCFHWIFPAALLLILFPRASFSQNDSLSQSQAQPTSKHDTDGVAAKTSGSAPPLRVVSNSAFSAGESLTFLVRYGPIIAGNARLSIPQIVEVNGRPCYNIVSEAWSNNFFSKFFKVEDRVESYTDVDGIFSWQFRKRLREGSFKADQEVTFDQVKHLAITKKQDKNDTLAVPPFVQDVLSAMYLIRTMEMAPGDSIFIDNHSDGKLFPLKIVVHKREKINIKAGKFSCLVVEPFLKTPALFQQKGRVVVHMTDDARKIPVMMTSQLYVKAFKLGAVVAELEKIEGVPGY